MNIEIRAWDTDSDQYVNCGHHQIRQIMNNYGGLGNRFIYELFSGFLDKNSVKVYEGDIIRSASHHPSDYTIEFRDGGFCGVSEKLTGYPIDINHFYPSVGNDIEVIGNIHESSQTIRA